MVSEDNLQILTEEDKTEDLLSSSANQHKLKCLNCTVQLIPWKLDLNTHWHKSKEPHDDSEMISSKWGGLKCSSSVAGISNCWKKKVGTSDFSVQKLSL
ncbi:hypothetical protein AAC387_Pa06g1866 [Persea americana]